MDRCENCVYGINIPIPDRQIRREKRCLDNWKCNHPDKEIRISAQQKGWSESCPVFKSKHKIPLS